MELFMFLVLVGIHGTAATLHSLQYFYTGSTGLEGQFPAFVAVGIVDGNQIDYYDSVSEKNVLKQTWMEGVRDENRITDIRRGTQQTFAASVGIVMQRFNQTAGVHLYQNMYGCEWDDETDEVNGYYQDGYDGEDFVSFDRKTETWTAPTQQAVITKHKWDNNKGWIAQVKNYLTQECPDWVKKYVNYGRSSLMRKDLPSVSLLQKTSSSPVTCHATGFYPDRADLFWRKDGEELHEDVDKGEILPNHDGTFQMSVDLKISSIADEDWKKYDCVFQLSGVKDINTKLDKSVIRSNEVNPLAMIIPIVVAVVVLSVIAVVGFIVYKKKKDKRPPSPVENREVQEEMLPQA
ncbi:class I histocompatibility antigen, F10 alpha chain-like isoform X2 [Acanthochromis polyacanthus]|uniref:class I histocompatibility antigen, F10 alpha chain-like isoform X2 n=1 Tax=Acanthochromis polyacanthus TaxID=80966 RepID=UPI002233FBB9|nr:class I histocompatibility antigen, F10 alpha chain-like isoform X2 [Acanthochromis polyacanthus]